MDVQLKLSDRLPTTEITERLRERERQRQRQTGYNWLYYNVAILQRYDYVLQIING